MPGPAGAEKRADSEVFDFQLSLSRKECMGNAGPRIDS